MVSSDQITSSVDGKGILSKYNIVDHIAFYLYESSYQVRSTDPKLSLYYLEAYSFFREHLKSNNLLPSQISFKENYAGTSK